MPIKNPPHSVTGAVVRELRLTAGLTLQALAAKVGCSFQHLARVETGERILTPELSKRITQAVIDISKERVA